MPIPAWPGGLTEIIDRNSFQRKQHHRPLLVTAVEDGPDLSRVQGQTHIEEFDVTLLFSDAEYATFYAFVETTLLQGSLQFTMSVPVVGSTFVTRRVYIKGGTWSDRANGPYWHVSFTLCVFPT